LVFAVAWGSSVRGTEHAPRTVFLLVLAAGVLLGISVAFLDLFWRAVSRLVVLPAVRMLAVTFAFAAHGHSFL